MARNSPRTFVSYSWDNDSHCEWVRELATRLRLDGVDVVLDRWELVPGDRVPHFMETAVRDSDFVVIICTPRYKERSDQRKGGVGYEGDIMTGAVLNGENRRKFIPVLREGNAQDSCPSWLSGMLFVDLSGSEQTAAYETLLQALFRDSPQKPPLGPQAGIVPTSTMLRFVVSGVDRKHPYPPKRRYELLVDDQRHLIAHADWDREAFQCYISLGQHSLSIRYEEDIPTLHPEYPSIRGVGGWSAKGETDPIDITFEHPQYIIQLVECGPPAAAVSQVAALTVVPSTFGDILFSIVDSVAEFVIYGGTSLDHRWYALQIAVVN